MIGDSHRTAPLGCPGCGVGLIGHMEASLDNPGPHPGAVAVCIHCSTISVYVAFNGQLALRLPDDDQMDEILRDPAAQDVIAVARAYRERQL